MVLLTSYHQDITTFQKAGHCKALIEQNRNGDGIIPDNTPSLFYGTDENFYTLLLYQWSIHLPGYGLTLHHCYYMLTVQLSWISQTLERSIITVSSACYCQLLIISAVNVLLPPLHAATIIAYVQVCSNPIDGFRQLQILLLLTLLLILVVTYMNATAAIVRSFYIIAAAVLILPCSNHSIRNIVWGQNLQPYMIL